jgi:hypothetical protein
MGPAFREDDHLISSLLDLANLRFAPSYQASTSPELIKDGIIEMIALQKEFKVFSQEHSLSASFAVLGLGGFWNTTLKNKLYGYLDESLARTPSETEEFGNQRIISALQQNLESERPPPRPVYFTTHDAKLDGRVLVRTGRPLVYMSNEYLIISLPMTPWIPPAAPRKRPAARRRG